jgi:hypothetical protein
MGMRKIEEGLCPFPTLAPNFGGNPFQFFQGQPIEQRAVLEIAATIFGEQIAQDGPARVHIGLGTNEQGAAVIGADNDRLAIQRLYGLLAIDKARNEMIFDDILSALMAGWSPVVITERKDHLQTLADHLSKFAKNVIVLKGGMGAKERRRVSEALAAVPDGEERVLVATGRYLGEGFDDARLDTLFLTMPISWRGTSPNMPVVCTGCMRPNARWSPTTMWTAMSRCWPGCR